MFRNPFNQRLRERPQKKSCLRALWRAFKFLFLLVLVNVVVFGVVAWNRRIEWATRIVRKELDKRGLSDDVWIEIDTLLPNRIALRNVRVGKKEELLSSDWIEVRFSFPEILNGWVDSIRVRDINVLVDFDDGQVTIPLVERLKPLMSTESMGNAGTTATPLNFGVGFVSAFNVNFLVRNGNAPLLTLTTDANVAWIPGGRYYGTLGIGGRNEDFTRYYFSGWLQGMVSQKMDEIQLHSEITSERLESLINLAQQVAPQLTAQLPVAVSNASATVRMGLNASAWTNVQNFQVTAELGRGSVVTIPEQNTEVTLQSARLEASGSLTGAQCRVSVGIAGIRSQGSVQVSQEEGRLLSVRGTAQFGDTATNRTLRATLDTDLSGRAAAKILPDLLPLMPRLLTDGGTLHAETALSQRPEAAWEGEARFLAEARRTSVTLPSGRFAASRAAVGGRVGIRGTELGEVQTEVIIEDGMYSSQGNSARANFRMALTAPPPYQEARGTFEGTVNASNWLARCGVRLAGTNGVALAGTAALKGITSAPEWLVALNVPAFDVMAAGGEWGATAGGTADIRYGATEAEVKAALWAEDVRWVSPELPKGGCATAGVGRVSMAVTLPTFSPEAASNAVARVAVGVSGGSCRAGDVFKAEDVRVDVPFTWSMAEGIAFPDAPGLAWGRMTLDGLRIEPTGFALTNTEGAVELRTGVRVEGSALNIRTSARVPLDNPQQLTVGIEIPDMVLEPEDSLAAWVRKMDKETRIAGNLAVRADLRMLGSQPYVLGRLDVTDGRLTRGTLDISGIRVNVPFEAGVETRTIQRPFVSFEAMNVGDVRLHNGRVDFQASPREFFIDRMEADFCKGKIHAYSIHLDPKNPSADVTVYADRIDLGEALMYTLPFQAQRIEGVLFGRFPVAVDNGHIRLKPGYLYSLPGQGGTFRVDDSRKMEPWLAQAGIPPDVKAPLAEALSDMDFSAIRIELDTEGGGGDAMLRLGLMGKSNSKSWPAPIDLKLNLRAPLETLLNMGLDMSRIKGDTR